MKTDLHKLIIFTLNIISTFKKFPFIGKSMDSLKPDAPSSTISARETGAPDTKKISTASVLM